VTLNIICCHRNDTANVQIRISCLKDSCLIALDIPKKYLSNINIYRLKIVLKHNIKLKLLT